MASRDVSSNGGFATTSGTQFSAILQEESSPTAKQEQDGKIQSVALEIVDSNEGFVSTNPVLSKKAISVYDAEKDLAVVSRGIEEVATPIRDQIIESLRQVDDETDPNSKETLKAITDLSGFNVAAGLSTESGTPLQPIGCEFTVKEHSVTVVPEAKILIIDNVLPGKKEETITNVRKALERDKSIDPQVEKTIEEGTVITLSPPNTKIVEEGALASADGFWDCMGEETTPSALQENPANTKADTEERDLAKREEIAPREAGVMNDPSSQQDLLALSTPEPFENRVGASRGSESSKVDEPIYPYYKEMVRAKIKKDRKRIYEKARKASSPEEKLTYIQIGEELKREAITKGFSVDKEVDKVKTCGLEFVCLKEGDWTCVTPFDEKRRKTIYDNILANISKNTQDPLLNDLQKALKRGKVNFHSQETIDQVSKNAKLRARVLLNQIYQKTEQRRLEEIAELKKRNEKPVHKEMFVQQDTSMTQKTIAEEEKRASTKFITHLVSVQLLSSLHRKQSSQAKATYIKKLRARAFESKEEFQERLKETQKKCISTQRIIQEKANKEESKKKDEQDQHQN